jgi:hypothetical protein
MGWDERNIGVAGFESIYFSEEEIDNYSLFFENFPE